MMDVYCLCADWCGSCRAFRPQLDAFFMHGFDLYWLDIEDHAEAVGDIEILTFPTIVVANSQGQIYFAGDVEPRVSQLQRLLHSLDGQPPILPNSKDWESFVHAIRRSEPLIALNRSEFDGGANP